MNIQISQSEAIADTGVLTRQNEIQLLQKGNTIWARIRNAASAWVWSEWSIIAALVLAPPGAFGSASGRFRWVLVASARGYEIATMLEGTGSWKMIFDGIFLNSEYFWTPPSGTHRFRIRSKLPDGTPSAWIEIEITIP